MCAQRREKGRRERQSTAMGGKNLSNKSVYEKERERERTSQRQSRSSLCQQQPHHHTSRPNTAVSCAVTPSAVGWAGKQGQRHCSQHHHHTTTEVWSAGGGLLREGGALQTVTDFQGGHNTADSVPGVPRLSAVHSEKWISAVSQSMCACILNPNTEHLGLADSN